MLKSFLNVGHGFPERIRVFILVLISNRRFITSSYCAFSCLSLRDSHDLVVLQDGHHQCSRSACSLDMKVPFGATEHEPTLYAWEHFLHCTTRPSSGRTWKTRYAHTSHCKTLELHLMKGRSGSSSSGRMLSRTAQV